MNEFMSWMEWMNGWMKSLNKKNAAYVSMQWMNSA